MQKVDFATIISKAFEHAANEDAKNFIQLLTSSSCSSSKSQAQSQPQVQVQVHLVPNNWMASFQTYLETKSDIHKPGSIENHVLLKQSFLDLQHKDNDSLHCVILSQSQSTNSSSSTNSSTSSRPTTGASGAASSKCRPASPSSTSASASLSCTSSASSTSEMALADDEHEHDHDHDDKKKQNQQGEGEGEANGADPIIISCSPSSSTTTNNSYVLVNTDAQSFVKNETTGTGTGASTDAAKSTTKTKTKTTQQESGETSASTSMDDRTKRRLKWATKKEQQDQEQEQIPKKTAQPSNESSSSSSLSSSLTSSSSPSSPSPSPHLSSSSNKNVLKKAILHEIDYYILGHNTWTLLSSKFGFDIDIQTHVAVNDNISNSMSGGWGRLCVVGLSDDVLVPEDGIFDYAKNIVSGSNNSNNDYGNGNASGSLNGGNIVDIDYNIHNHGGGGGDDDDDDDNDSTKNNQDVDDLDEDDLYNDDDDDEENDHASSSTPILLLPPSTTSYTSNIDHTTSTSASASALTVSSSSCLHNINDNSNSPNNNNNNNPRKRKRYGLGLGNLGNTCFMNSTLQCLAHTGPLRSYFLSGEFAHDLNRDNPLGTGGELAQEFANLLAEMWGTNQQQEHHDVSNNYLSSTSTSTSRHSSYRRAWSGTSSSNVVYPRNFKYTLGKHAEQFMGYNQHDSQELATYLLDALHEDTNRVSKKPYVEKPEQREDESDDEAAKRAWELHLKREDSRVMENFMGQVKSRVECPIQGCGRVSTTFDPFMYLSVPLPGATERTIEVDFFPMGKNQNIKRIKVTLSKNANCSELKKKFTATINELLFQESGEHVHAENIVLAENFHKELYTYYEPDDEVAKIRDGDHVVAYEVASVQSIRDEVDKRKEEDRATQGEESSEDEVIDDRPYGRLKLDVSEITNLNSGDEWERTLMAYMVQPTYFAALMNPKRKRLEDRKEFQNRLTKFINRCYASPECNEVLQGGRITPSSDVEIDSCDGNDSEDGKMSPTSTVATQLKAAAVDDKAVPSLEELSFSSKTFKNVKNPKDVAMIEFCSKKFRQYVKNEKEKAKLEYADGAEIQIMFKKGGQFSTPQAFANPLVLRISPALTVYQLRQVLAERLSHVLRNPGKKDSPVDEVVKEEKVENENRMNDDMDCTGDQNELCFPNCSNALKLMCQVPLTYERGGSSYSYRYGNKGNSYRKLGSVQSPGDSTTASQVSVFAKPNEADEKELVLDHVGCQGKVNLCLLTSQLQQIFDVEEWSKVETISDPNDEDNTTGVTSVIDCISKYCQIEQLEDTEMWYCNRCKDHVRAWKQFHLYRTPPILIIHLKRFHYSALTHRRDKIDSFIDFPLEGLDLRKEVMFSEDGEEPIYDCYAVSNHFGGLGGGHYTAYALNDDGEWCNFDDSRVTANVEKSEVVSKSAYVLYYKRRDVKTDDELWVNRALPAVCSREPSPVTTNMDIEGGDSDNIYSMDDNEEDDDYGIKQFESISATRSL